MQAIVTPGVEHGPVRSERFMDLFAGEGELGLGRVGQLDDQAQSGQG